MKKIGFVFLGLLSGFLLSFLITNYNFYFNAVNAVLFGFIAALLTFFLDFCFREGNIFAFWIRFLNKYFYKNPKNPFRFLYKPLGGCSLCMNQWVSIKVFIIAFFAVDLPLYWIFLVGLTSHLILFFLLKHFDLED